MISNAAKLFENAGTQKEHWPERESTCQVPDLLRAQHQDLSFNGGDQKTRPGKSRVKKRTLN
jgi:hypothetical protein